MGVFTVRSGWAANREGFKAAVRTALCHVVPSANSAGQRRVDGPASSKLIRWSGTAWNRQVGRISSRRHHALSFVSSLKKSASGLVEPGDWPARSLRVVHLEAPLSACEMSQCRQLRRHGRTLGG